MKYLKQLKIVISFFEIEKKIKNLDYISIKIYIMRLALRYIGRFSTMNKIILKINQMNASVNQKSYGKP